MWSIRYLQANPFVYHEHNGKFLVRPIEEPAGVFTCNLCKEKVPEHILFQATLVENCRKGGASGLEIFIYDLEGEEVASISKRSKVFTHFRPPSDLLEEIKCLFASHGYILP